MIILVGNKKDLEAEREVTFLEASRFAQENGKETMPRVSSEKKILLLQPSMTQVLHSHCDLTTWTQLFKASLA